MQDKHVFSSHMNKVGKEASSETSLITLERSQKLDLLIHLISNLKKSLVICGKKGIGKTTLLDELNIRKKNDWYIVNVQVSSNLSFESFQHQVFRFLILHYSEYDSQDLFSTLSILAEQNQKVVVIIDDAALLVPGLITTLIQYATSNECLRIVFSLTHDELEIKKNSDRLIDECHYIDIPPLSEKQCGVFLKNLSVQPNVEVSLSEVNECMIRHIYHETHGVPGKIISELSTFSNNSRISDYKWMGVIFSIAVMVTWGIGYLIFDEDDSKNNSSNVIESKISIPVVLENNDNFDVSSSLITSVQRVKPIKEDKALVYNKKEQRNKKPIIFSYESNRLAEKKNENLLEEIGKNKQEQTNDKFIKLPEVNEIVPKSFVENNPKGEVKGTEKKLAKIGFKRLEKKEKKLKKDEKNSKINDEDKRIVEKKKSVSNFKKEKKNSKIEFIAVSKPKKIDKKKRQKIINSAARADDRLWVLSQPKENFTMQLMVLSSHDSVVKFLKKNNKLKNKLKFFKLGKQSKSKYVVIYGSFKDASEIFKEMKSLPEKFKKAWVRKFSKIQKKIKDNN